MERRVLFMRCDILNVKHAESIMTMQYDTGCKVEPWRRS